ncbi:MAG: hypothetical protein RL033_4601 [Pseudomonadota bacterium]
MKSARGASIVPPEDTASVPSATRGRVFISHASDDEDVARALWQELDAERRQPYLAVVSSGERLAAPARVLSEALASCDRLLVVWSVSAANAVWVRFEWLAFWRLRGAQAIELILLDDTPYPNHLCGSVQKAKAEWRGMRRAASNSLPGPRTSERSRLYITSSPSGQEEASRIATLATGQGYDVVHIWKDDFESASRTSRHTGGDWVLVAADIDEEPLHWELSFGDNPDEHPRRLVVAAPDAKVPALLQLFRPLPMPSGASFLDWLSLPRPQVSALLAFQQAWWKQLASRLHDQLAPDFSAIDPRLSFSDPRSESILRVLWCKGLSIATLAHVAAAASTFVLPLVSAPATRRHLVLSLTMLVFAGAALRVYSMAAGLMLIVHGGWLGALAVLVSGHFGRHGVPGVAFGAGVALGALAMTQMSLATPSAPLVNRAGAAVLWSLGGVLAAGVLLLAGLLLLVWAGGSLELWSPWQRSFWGLGLGAVGGVAVGAVLGWIRAYAHRRRERGTAWRTMVWSVLLSSLLTAFVATFSSGNANEVLDGLGVGLFAGALIVVLWLAPTAAMKRAAAASWLPFMSSAIAIVATGLVALIFRNVPLREYITLALTAGVAAGAIMVRLPSWRHSRHPALV